MFLGHVGSEEGAPGLSLEDVKQAWLTVPKPNRGSGIRHEEAVVGSLRSNHQVQVEAQEARLEGLTRMQVQLMREILKWRKEANMDMKPEPSMDRSYPQVGASTALSSTDPLPGPLSLGTHMSGLVLQLLDTLTRCSDLEQLRMACRLPSLKAASARLLVLLDLGLMQEARILELHGIQPGDEVSPY